MLCCSVGMCWPLFTDVLACATGLHVTYPKDRQRAQEVKEKLLAEHDVEAHPAHPQPHQVACVLCNVMITYTRWPGSKLFHVLNLHIQHSSVYISRRLT